MAIQYGMPLNEFWHGDMRLFDAYQKAYIRDKSYTAWVNGLQNFEANSKSVQNALRSKESDPVQKYADWVDPIKTKSKAVKCNIDPEKEFRESQKRQNDWLRGMINKNQ